MKPLTRDSTFSLCLQEWPLLANLLTAGLFLGLSDALLADLSRPAWFVFVLIWLFAATLLSSFAIVRHAESLAVKLGEPLGTLVLTLAVTGMEVMLIAATMAIGGNPALARDAMFAVVMIVLNGMVGLTLFHRARREVLKVHRRADLSNPLTGVFSTRSPDRPNPLGFIV